MILCLETAVGHGRMTLLLSPSKNGGITNRRLRIEGDTDLGLTAKNLLDGVELEALTAQMPAPVRMALNLLRQRLAAQASPI